jgi:hypothetical protein
MMATLLMSVPVEVVVKDGKKKEKLHVEVREMTRDERKEADKVTKKYKDLSFRLERVSSALESAKKKAEYAEKLEDFKKALSFQEKVDEFQAQLEDLVEEVNKLGGDDFAQKQAKINFDRLVSGDGKERLEEIAEEKGYNTVMQLLWKAKAEVEGKQEGA